MKQKKTSERHGSTINHQPVHVDAPLIDSGCVHLIEGSLIYDSVLDYGCVQALTSSQLKS